MRAALYARYSSDLQSAASIEDQVRECQALVAREGWLVAETYTDMAVSAASARRPGYQQMLADARERRFDVLVAEALDRLSRDQADTAILHREMSFLGIAIVTVTEGPIGELHVGFKGTINAVYLKDLAHKTRRGLEGRVRQGRSAGGLTYGYRPVRRLAANGEPETGLLEIEPAEAAVVCRIFRDYADGASAQAIARRLNAEGVPGPRGGTWGSSTVLGNWRRGTGILNNELYVGRRVWNRLRYVKDPETGRRVSRAKAANELVMDDVPELRIVDDALWQQVRQRQEGHRRAVAEAPDRNPVRARRPRYLLSGLLACGACGGGYSMISATHLGCSTARNKGTCDNRLTIRREAVEQRVLAALREKLMAPELVAEYVAEYQAEMNRLLAERDRAREGLQVELRAVGRRIAAMLDAIEQGVVTATTRDRLLALEAKQTELQHAIAAAPAPLPRLHPGIAEVYRERVANLQAELTRPELRQQAAEALRRLIARIRLVPEAGDLAIEVEGDLAALLQLGQGHGNGRRNANSPAAGAAAGLQVSLVAGAGFEPATFRL